MNQPMFTFSPDGLKVYAFFPNARLIKYVCVGIGVILLACAFVLAQIGMWVAGIVNYLLTAPTESLLRVLIVVIVTLAIVLVSRFRRAFPSSRPVHAQEA